MFLLKTYNTEVDVFLKYACQQLDYSKVDVHVSLENYVVYPGDDEKCNGYFYDNNDEDGKVYFAVAVGNPLEEWFPVFVHEFCHFTQWKDQIHEWNNVDDEESKMWDWIAGDIELSSEERETVFKPSFEIELDCERRVLKMIDKFNLPINKKEYAKKSAAYVLFYEYMKENRKWYKVGKEPYKNKELINLMPINLDGDLVLTDEMKKIYNKCV